MNQLFYGHNQIIDTPVVTIANLTYDDNHSVYDDITELEVNGFSLNTDGSRLFSSSGTDIYHTNYTARFNLNFQDIASVVKKSIVASASTASTMSRNGENFYTSSVSRVVRWHELSTANDMSTADPNPTSFNMPNMGVSDIIYDMSISSDGVHFVCGTSNGSFCYILATPYDPTTAIYQYQLTNQDHYGCTWANDGNTYIYLVETVLTEITLNSPYDLSDIASQINKSVSAQSPNGLGVSLIGFDQIGIGNLSTKKSIDVYDL